MDGAVGLLRQTRSTAFCSSQSASQFTRGGQEKSACVDTARARARNIMANIYYFIDLHRTARDVLSRNYDLKFSHAYDYLARGRRERT